MKMQPKMTDESGFKAQGKIGAPKIKALPARTNTTMKIPKEALTSKGMGRESMREIRRLQKNEAPLAIAINKAMIPKGNIFARSSCAASWKKYKEVVTAM